MAPEVTKPVTGLDCLIPTTLEVNVRYLHEFLFASEAYEPSDTVKIRSDFVADKTGFGNTSVKEEWQRFVKERTEEVSMIPQVRSLISIQKKIMMDTVMTAVMR